MVMIRCPNCGQRTLDVASKCPKCGHVLLQNPLEANAHSDLTSCRRCGKHIERQAAVCPFCGHHVLRTRKLIVTGWVVAGLAVAAVAGLGAYRAGYLDALIPREGLPVAAAPAPLDTTPAPETAPVPEAPPAARPIVVLPADTARPSAPEAAPPGTAAARPPRTEPSVPVASLPSSLLVRWTSDWANVRQGRSVDAPVVRVLAPGSEISVARMRDGWWEYYEAGSLRGYIANSVLGAGPPG